METTQKEREARVLAAAKAWLAAFGTPQYEAAFEALEEATAALVRAEGPQS